MNKREMEDGGWYDFTPPVVVGGKKFPKGMCEFQVPKCPNEYVVCGIPEGGTEKESFVLRFTDRGVRVTPSNPPPPLRLVQ